jgi:hypothetical protein
MASKTPFAQTGKKGMHPESRRWLTVGRTAFRRRTAVVQPLHVRFFHPAL